MPLFDRRFVATGVLCRRTRRGDQLMTLDRSRVTKVLNVPLTGLTNQNQSFFPKFPQASGFLHPERAASSTK